MWTVDKDFPARGFSTPPPTAKSRRWSPGLPTRPLSEKKRSSPQGKADLFHVVHKVPAGDSPYVRAKHVQLIDKDPNKAISLFWGAINSGDRVDSALKDMAVVMKQLNRSDEAIEAIKSFRHLCPPESQESLDNLLVELYKRSGRIEEQIEMLQLKVKKIEEGIAFGGKRVKSARSQGKKIQITVEQEYSRLLGNLAWAYLQQNNFKFAEELYRKALSLETDKNKQCNLAICLMHMNKITEAKFLLQTIQASYENGPFDDSYARSFERATQMLTELESQSTEKPIAQQEESHKGGSYRENSNGRRADVGCKRNSKWVSSNGMEVGSFCKKPYVSPVPAMGFRKVPYTQPRRCSRSFIDADQRKAALWTNGFFGGSNSKLSFEQPTADETSKVALQNWESGSSCFTGDWRKMSWGNLAEQNNVVTEPVEEALSGQVCGRSSSISITNGLTVVDNCVRGLSSQNLDSSCELAAENVKQLHGYSTGKTKKTWADMVEEDEQEVSRGRTYYPESEWSYPCQDLSCQTPRGGSDGLSSGEESEEFNDENMDSNVNNPNLTTPDQIENLSQKFKAFDLKDGYCTQPENAASSTNQTARRSLCFDQHQQPGGADNYCSSPLPKTALNFESYSNSLLVDERREHPSGSGIKLLRRNRLQVFRDITRFSDSPGL